MVRDFINFIIPLFSINFNKLILFYYILTFVENYIIFSLSFLGMVEEDEFVKWIQQGIAQPEEKRIKWGAMSDTQGRLLSFLISVVQFCQRSFLEGIFREFDRDQDHGLSHKELVALMVEMKMRSITQTDLTTSLSSVAEDATIVLKALDTDKNGMVDKNEFVQWLTDGRELVLWHLFCCCCCCFHVIVFYLFYLDLIPSRDSF